MAWVRLEDTFPEHPKIDACGGDAAWLHVCAIAYCNRNETDGFIATDRLPRLSDRRRPTLLAERLVNAGLWEPEPGGWRIHDYLDYQPSRAARDKERQAARERMRRARDGSGDVHDRSPHVRPNNDRSSPNPVPSRPVPSVNKSSSSLKLVAPDTDDDDRDPFTKTIAIIVRAKENDHPPDNPAAWRPTVTADVTRTHGPTIRDSLNGGATPVQAAACVLRSTTSAEYAARQLDRKATA